MLRGQKHALSQSTTPLACTLAWWIAELKVPELSRISSQKFPDCQLLKIPEMLCTMEANMLETLMTFVYCGAQSAGNFKCCKFIGDSYVLAHHGARNGESSYNFAAIATFAHHGSTALQHVLPFLAGPRESRRSNVFIGARCFQASCRHHALNSEGLKGGRRKGGRGRKLSHFSFCCAFRCRVVYSPCFPVWGEEL